ncbi:MAG: hypothetical protein V3S24_04945 [Candidatus Tectomicrobia bacterium]
MRRTQRLDTRYQDYFERMPHDERDPMPSKALCMDTSTPIDPESKAALLYGLDSKCRQFLLPVIRPLCRALIVLNQVLKIFLPKSLSSSLILHYLIYLGLKYCVSRHANLLIARHFHLGSEILQFIRDNVAGVDIKLTPLKPKRLEDVKDHLFLQHDLNLFNFVINLNRELQTKNLSLTAPETINYDAITDGPIEMEEFPDTWHNVIDVETAIEIYTPVFQFFLTDNDFWRASNSLQLDETIGIYVSTIMGDTSHLWRINNRHPLVPLTTLRAGYRLLLHGLSSETLHYLLRMKKRQQHLSSEA